MSAFAMPSTCRLLLSRILRPYMIGREMERGGMIYKGAKLLHAYAEATVPLITVLVRKAYAGAYIAMGSQYIGADPGLRVARRRDFQRGAQDGGQHNLPQGNRPGQG